MPAGTGVPLLRKAHQDPEPAAGHRPAWRQVYWLGSWAVPILVLATLAGFDLLFTPELVYLPLLSLAPAFASVRLRPGHVAVVGLAAMALWVPMASNDHVLGAFGGFVALGTIAGATLVGVASSAVRRRNERELMDVQAVVRIAERVLLREPPARVGQLELAARYLSAASAARIGGDVYDVVSTGETVRILLGDVQGKGLPAVQTASVVLGAFRESAYDAPGLAEIAQRIELSLARRAPDGRFVTAVLAQARSDGSRIEILNCGHPPPLLLAAGEAHFAEPPVARLPLGLGDLAPLPWHTSSLPLRAGDQILFYTDGISEARDGSGAFYPLKRSAPLLVQAGPDQPDPDQSLARLTADVTRYAGGTLRDDATMLLLRRSAAIASK